MRTLDLGRRFDAITCLFSAIGHLADTTELRMAIAAMARHLEPGGVLVVEPWIEPEAWLSDRPSLLTVDEPDLKIARVTLTGRRGNTSTLDFRYLVATPDVITTHAEQMELALFTAAEMRHAFEQAELDVEHDPDGLIGRGLFVGRSPTAPA
jgi:SAM-dependent methyltransferase